MSSTDTDFSGTVKWYNIERGFGFITVDDGSPDMYVHATGLSLDGPLMENDRVSFITEVDSRTNKPKAMNVVRATEEEAPAPVAVAEEPVVESFVETVIEIVKEELNEDEKREKSIKMETFQRARLQVQVEQMAKDIAAAVVVVEEGSVDYDANARLSFEASGASGDFDTYKTQYFEDTSAMTGKKFQDAIATEKAAAEAAAAEKAAAEKAAAEAAAAEKAAAEKAAAEAAAAKEAEEKRLAEEAAEAAALAAKEAEDAAAKELGYSSAEIMKVRQQPKSTEEEAALATKYGAMDLGEKAFTILVDLGMVELNPDPDDANRDTSKDDEDLE